jgi:hypothetical protein
MTRRTFIGILSAVTLAAGLAVTALASTTAAAPPPVSRPCPGASVVNLILGQHARAPVKSKVQGGESCTYPGTAPSSAALTTITFQTVTASEFASVEKVAIMYTHGVIKMKGLGQAAWATNAGIHVLDGHEEIAVEAPWLAALHPSSAFARIEALVRALL